MPKLPRLSSQEAEALLLKAGFELARSKGSPKIVKHLMGVLDPVA